MEAAVSVLLLLARGSPLFQDLVWSVWRRPCWRRGAGCFQAGPWEMGCSPQCGRQGCQGLCPGRPGALGGWESEGAMCRRREPWSPRGAWEGKAERQALDAGLLYCQGRKGHKHRGASKAQAGRWCLGLPERRSSFRLLPGAGWPRAKKGPWGAAPEESHVCAEEEEEGRGGEEVARAWL